MPRGQRKREAVKWEASDDISFNFELCVNPQS